MADEKSVKLVVENDVVKMVTTITKTEVSEEDVDIDILQKKIDNYRQHVANAEKEIIRVRAVADGEIGKLKKQVTIWEAEIAELEKQIVEYGKLELPTED